MTLNISSFSTLWRTRISLRCTPTLLLPPKNTWQLQQKPPEITDPSKMSFQIQWDTLKRNEEISLHLSQGFQKWDVSLRRVRFVWHRGDSFKRLLRCGWECVYFGVACWPTGLLVRNVLSDMLTLAVLTNGPGQSVSMGTVQIWEAPSSCRDNLRQDNADLIWTRNPT